MDLVAATGMPCADGGLQSRAALWQRFEVGPKSPGRREKVDKNRVYPSSLRGAAHVATWLP